MMIFKARARCDCHGMLYSLDSKKDRLFYTGTPCGNCSTQFCYDCLSDDDGRLLCKNCLNVLNSETV